MKLTKWHELQTESTAPIESTSASRTRTIIILPMVNRIQQRRARTCTWCIIQHTPWSSRSSPGSPHLPIRTTSLARRNTRLRFSVDGADLTLMHKPIASVRPDATFSTRELNYQEEPLSQELAQKIELHRKWHQI